MGIDRLIKAANAAGYAMANSEDLLVPTPTAAKKGDAPGWRATDPAAAKAAKPATPHATGAFRDWWFTLSGKATA